MAWRRPRPVLPPAGLPFQAFSGKDRGRAARAAAATLTFIFALLLAGNAAECRAETTRAETVMPRTVLALLDPQEADRPRFSRIHTLADMPLGFLGLRVVYWDTRKGLPNLDAYPDLRGILTWYNAFPFDDPGAYLQWLEAALDRGLKVVIFEEPGLASARNGLPAPPTLSRRLFQRLGLDDSGNYISVTYGTRVAFKDAQMLDFERPLGGVLPAYPVIGRADPRVRSFLTLRSDESPATESHIVTTSPWGGYVPSQYTHHRMESPDRQTWLINPFRYFSIAFDTDPIPKPDPTTVSGRRVYFSHIDGDGWRNLSDAEGHRQERTLAAEVIERETIIPYPSLPVTVGPVAGDLQPDVPDGDRARTVARRLFALPQVEAGSHTWTHPYDWDFFTNYSPEIEAQAFRNRLANPTESASALVGDGSAANGRNELPRAYAPAPFSLDQEIAGALDDINALLPPGKRVTILQWSGNAAPFEAAFAAVRQANVRNINGGESRLDAEYPSYASVAPLGIAVGNARQIYAAGSNENTYTDLWTNRFFGFQKLTETIRNTETPIRIKPFNIYYHMYSGEKTASLSALKSNLDYARNSEISPVSTSDYAAMADGFYSSRFVVLGNRHWRMENHDGLATVRFDRATFLGVDFSRSRGILGQRHYQGALYVALDPAVPAPEIALTDLDRADREPPAPRPYLIHGRWLLEGLEPRDDGFTVRAHGFGPGEARWKMPHPGTYLVEVLRDGQSLWQNSIASSNDGELAFTVPADAITPLRLSVRLSPPP